MKRILLSLMVLATAGSVNAQLLEANDASSFSTWTAFDLDGDTLTWSLSDFTGAGTQIDGVGECATSASYGASGALTPDNALVSTPIDCSGSTNVFLNWAAGSPETDASGWYEEHYAVYVLTLAEINAIATATGTFPTPVFETTLLGGEVMFAEEVDITAMAAGNADIYVAFRHFNCTDESVLVLDDVKVSEASSASIEENGVVANIYPNPASDVLNINASNEVSTVSIIALDGKVISTTTVNGTSTSVNISDLNAGIYVYEVVTIEGTVRNTFVKK